MVQIENEFGCYGEDREYLEINRNLFIEAGFDGLLFSSICFVENRYACMYVDIPEDFKTSSNGATLIPIVDKRCFPVRRASTR